MSRDLWVVSKIALLGFLTLAIVKCYSGPSAPLAHPVIASDIASDHPPAGHKFTIEEWQEFRLTAVMVPMSALIATAYYRDKDKHMLWQAENWMDADEKDPHTKRMWEQELRKSYFERMTRLRE